MTPSFKPLQVENTQRGLSENDILLVRRSNKIFFFFRIAMIALQSPAPFTENYDYLLFIVE